MDNLRIEELKTVSDHCRLTLRDGRMYLARLDADRSLRLDEIADSAAAPSRGRAELNCAWPPDGAIAQSGVR